MTEEQTPIEATIKAIFPLAPINVVMDIKEGDKVQENVVNVLFLDQVNNCVFDLEGPVDPTLQKAIFEWIIKKQQETRNMIAHATPEQLRQMGIDINSNEMPSQNSHKKIIM